MGDCPALLPRNSSYLNAFNGIEGYLTKHKRIKGAWNQVQKIEGNFRSRWFVIHDGTLFYFSDRKISDKALESNTPLSKVAKGFVPLHSCTLIESESISQKKYSFVLQMTSTSQEGDPRSSQQFKEECLLVCAESEEEKERWIGAIKRWQSKNLANLQKVGFKRYSESSLYSEEDNEEDEYEEFRTLEGVPYFMNTKTKETCWEKPSSIKEKKMIDRFSHGSFIAWVRVLKGKDIKSGDMSIPNSGPYCKVIFKTLQYKTSKSTKTADPEWTDLSERFEFLIEERDMNPKKNQFLNIQVFDRTKVDTPRMISSSKVPLDTLWEAFGAPIEKWIQLELADGKIQGKVLLELQLGLATVHISSSSNRPSVFSMQRLLQNQFGVLLTQIAQEPERMRNFVPKLVADACDSIRKRGLHEQGIFRLSGSKSAIFRLRVYCNLNWEYNFDEEDVNVVAGLLKLFLRQMPEPLIPVSVYPRVIAITANSKFTQDEHAEQIKQLLFNNPNIPEIHLNTMKIIFKLMYDISQLSQDNLMHPKNLAVVLGPNILRLADQTGTETVSDIPYVQSATELLIDRCNFFFDYQ